MFPQATFQVFLSHINNVMSELTVLECIRGNRTAQKELYDKYAGSMYVLCQRYFQCREEAMDALQEGFIKVFKDLSQFDSAKGSFVLWIRRIFINTCLEMLRKRKMIFSDINEMYDLMEENVNALDNLGLKDLVSLIQKLPDGYRTVFNLYVIEGYSHAEIAGMLNITENTSKSQLFKAKNALKKAFEMAFNYYEYESK